MKTSHQPGTLLARATFVVAIAVALWPVIASADLIDDLNGNDAVAADNAYVQLFMLEDGAIDALLGNTGQTNPYAGLAWANPLSSVLIHNEDERPTCGVVSMYLVEAILQSRLTPWLLPQFHHATETNQAVLASMADSAYQSWWAAHQGETISQLRSGPQPLDPPNDVAWR
jgi:hypothetical protein